MVDHMLSVEWTASDGWLQPRITPYQNLSLDPATCVLHYAFTCFEGTKAYKDKNGDIRLFRPCSQTKPNMTTELRKINRSRFYFEWKGHQIPDLESFLAITTAHRPDKPISSNHSRKPFAHKYQFKQFIHRSRQHNQFPQHSSSLIHKPPLQHVL